MIGHFDNLDSAANTSSHPLMQVTDFVAAVWATTSVFWWDLIDTGGHYVLLALGLIGGALRIALMIREWHRGKK